MAKVREVYSVLVPTIVLEGAGVPVNRILPHPDIEYSRVDPFLLLDELEFDEIPEESFPNHAHRGFEIITYMLQGQATHKDNLGNEQLLKAGDAQRIMTGSGMTHGEGFDKESKFIHGLQLWINLSKEDKKTQPIFDHGQSEDFPVKKIDGGTIKTIVGDGSPLTTRTPALYYDISLLGDLTLDIPERFNALIYVYQGELSIGEENKVVIANEMAVLGEGDKVEITSDVDSKFILIAAKPHNEEVIWYGPFVD